MWIFVSYASDLWMCVPHTSHLTPRCLISNILLFLMDLMLLLWGTGNVHNLVSNKILFSCVYLSICLLGHVFFRPVFLDCDLLCLAYIITTCLYFFHSIDEIQFFSCFLLSVFHVPLYTILCFSFKLLPVALMRWITNFFNYMHMNNQENLEAFLM